MISKSILPRALLVSAVVSSAWVSVPVQSANAQATTASYTTEIYLQNPNPNPATAIVNFYAELSGTPETFNVPVNLAQNGSTVVAIGGLSPNFKGSAVVSADQNVVAAAAQVPTEAQVNRIIYSAFNASSGTSNLFLSTFLARRNNQFSTFAVQNTESVPVNIRARFIEGATTIDTVDVLLPPYASKFFDSRSPTTTISTAFANYMFSNPLGFSGSVVVTATRQADGQPANIVGLSEERRSNNGQALGFEAIAASEGSNTVYLSSALCKQGVQQQDTYFAIQNMGSVSASVTITYIHVSGGISGTETTVPIVPGGKASLNPCALQSGSTGSAPGAPFNGSAVVVSSQPLNALVKKISFAAVNGNFNTAFLGQGSGAQSLAIPYVRWGSTVNGQNGSMQTFIAVQNVGNNPIPAGQMAIKFYPAAGGASPVVTCTNTAAVNPNAKVNASAGSSLSGTSCSGSFPQANFSGSVVIDGPVGSQLAAIATHQIVGYSFVTEDMNATKLP